MRNSNWKSPLNNSINTSLKTKKKIVNNAYFNVASCNLFLGWTENLVVTTYFNIASCKKLCKMTHQIWGVKNFAKCFVIVYILISTEKLTESSYYFPFFSKQLHNLPSSLAIDAITSKAKYIYGTLFLSSEYTTILICKYI